MILEHYPIKEKQATDRASQLAWLVREMGYSRDKVKGYEEKRLRLSRSPDQDLSVWSFMSGYWERYRKSVRDLAELDNPIMISKALQAEAKVVAGVADKVAFSFWLEAEKQGIKYDPEQMLDTSAQLIASRADELDSQYTDKQLMAFNNQDDFAANPMGQALLDLHVAFAQSPEDTETLRRIAIDGSAVGILMWAANGRKLAEDGYDVTMPQPGPVGSGGIIFPWED